MAHIETEKLWAFIDGDLNPEDLSKTNKHLELCSECQQVYLSQLKLHKALNSLDFDAPSMAFSNQVLEKINKNRAIDQSIHFWTNFTKYAIIGAISMTLIITVIVLSQQEVNLTIQQQNFNQYTLLVLSITLACWFFYGLDTLFFKLSKKLF